MSQNQSHLNQQKSDLKQVTQQKSQTAEYQPEIHPLLRLQKQIGNAYIARMLSDNDFQQGLPEVGDAGGPISNQLASRITRQLDHGESLPSHKRAQMESQFGQSLPDVHIHTGKEADDLNRSISARAFTLGSDLFFRDDASPDDDQLLNHELTHVMQQQSMPMGGPLTVGPSDDAYEHQAQSNVMRTSIASNIPESDDPYSTGSVVQRDLEDELNLGNISGLVGLGTSGLQAAAEYANTPLARMMGTTGGAITDASALGPLGGLASVAGLITGTQDMLNEDKPWYERVVGGMSAFGGATGTASTIAGLFGSSAFSAGGAAGLTAGAGSALTGGGAGLLTGAGAATALGSAGAVLGAGAAGYGAGRLLDEGVGALGRWATGDERGDYTISGGLASGMTAVDRAMTSLWADPDRPAYTQTLGWKLGEWLGI
jgi:hypothetical protein